MMRAYVCFAVALLACGAKTPPQAPVAPGSAAEQIASGKAVFAQHCAECHGDAGQGGDKAPPVVGPKALPLNPPATAKKRTMAFHSALDVGKFVMAAMPGDDPGSLKPDEYLAVLAFDLTANGVALDQPLTLESAGKIMIHP